MKEETENKTITIGGESVLPGKDKFLKITIDRLPTGTLIDIPVYVFNAKNPGPAILVQAGLHGDEVNGIEIVRRMLQNGNFKVKAGAIIAVPILNIFGFIHFSRDVPDGKDVNRSFPGTKAGSMASRIAYYYTREIMHQVDFAIDLHTGGGQRNNFPQVRYTAEDEKSVELASVFNAPLTFSSSLIKGSFRNVAFTMKKPTIVYEGGESMRFDDFSITEGVKGILRVLRYLGMSNPKVLADISHKTIHLKERKWLRASTAGIFIPKIPNGNKVKKGEEIGLVSDTYAMKTSKIKAPFDGYVICLNHQAVVNQGDALYHIGR
ncbi:MAG: succinylglutamate desuccinylase/aspartoacylase family protein [Maribacter sp.]